VVRAEGHARGQVTHQKLRAFDVVLFSHPPKAVLVARWRRNGERITLVFDDERSETGDIVSEPGRGVVNGPAVRCARREIEVVAQGARSYRLLHMLLLLLLRFQSASPGTVL
jgi:hypothetical protein